MLLIIPFFMITACELVVDVDVPDTGHQLSTVGLIASDSSWRLDVHQSTGILEFHNSFDSVTNATITITDESAGTSTVLTRQFYGRYRSPENPIPGHQYSIKIEAPGFETLTGSTVVPDAVPIKRAELDTTTTVRYTMKGGRYDDTHPLTITFDDVPGNNTYETEVIIAGHSVYLDNTTGYTIQYSYTGYAATYISDPTIVEKNDFYNTDPNPHRFGDGAFEGQEKTLTILIPLHVFTYTYGEDNFFGTFLDKLTLRLYNQGYDYAKFVDTRNVQRDTEGDPFAQPAPVYSNLNNRNGIFAVKTATTTSWDFNK